jgi:hypothetical protein
LGHVFNVELSIFGNSRGTAQHKSPPISQL